MNPDDIGGLPATLFVFGLKSVRKKIKYLLTGEGVFYSLMVQVEP
jgi:hypothetical protein